MKPGRQQIFEINQKCRDGVIPHRHPDFARHMFRIPMQDFHALRKLYPGLANMGDPLALTAAWEEFERSPFAEPYRIGKLFRGVIRNGVIIK